MMLQGYFDASNTDRASIKVTAIGGYVGSTEAWDALWSEWQENLTTWGISAFHMSALLAGKGGVGSREASTRCVHSFGVLLAKSSLLTAVSASVRSDDWQAFAKDPAYSARCPKPYHACFDMLLADLALFMRLERPQDRIELVFDVDEQKQDTVEVIADDWKRRVPQFTSIEFKRVKDCPLVQIADLCAWAERKHWVEGGWETFMTRPLERLFLARTTNHRSCHWSLEHQRLVERVRNEYPRKPS